MKIEENVDLGKKTIENVNFEKIVKTFELRQKLSIIVHYHPTCRFWVKMVEDVIFGPKWTKILISGQIAG